MAAPNALTFLVIGRLGGRIRKNLEVAWHWGVDDITMSPKTKQFVAVGVTLAALAALGLRWWEAPPELRYPDTPDSATEWLCEACGRVELLTAREFQRRVPRGATGGAPGGMPSLTCGACSKLTLARAIRCDLHPDQLYLLRSRDGELDRCQICAPESPE